jgi:hypothetical protein
MNLIKSYAMEAHLVHFKEEYGSVANAAGHLDGLVVVGIFLKVKNDFSRATLCDLFVKFILLCLVVFNLCV